MGALSASICSPRTTSSGRQVEPDPQKWLIHTARTCRLWIGATDLLVLGAVAGRWTWSSLEPSRDSVDLRGRSEWHDTKSIDRTQAHSRRRVPGKSMQRTTRRRVGERSDGNV